MHFLDLWIYVEDGELHTATYRKPCHNPQYLHALSFHNESNKRGIFQSEALRFMINSSKPDSYYRDIDRLKSSLKDRLYPDRWLKTPPSEPQARFDFFQKIIDRRVVQPGQNNNCPAKQKRKHDESTSVFVTTFSDTRINLLRQFNNLKSAFRNAHLNKHYEILPWFPNRWPCE